ncbi:hypothetical protein D0T12_19685 [Actinomadura spongiicola]|uniref:Uncharacterized protein n=1 Tax=Actinomadura spongiicola TaxID=2303421 RepID=A0A372GGW1_9ACTN|nr:methyltransferase [Actinomadura spongiicola]RFS84339.1 hypothetical protein D0T12_19685 [Actinomadura spongiicola]
MKSRSDGALTPKARLSDDDERRIREVHDYLRSTGDIDAVTDVLPPRAPAEMIEAITTHCVVDHAGCLVFPTDPAAVRAFLRDHGLHPLRPFTGSVVRDRLAGRYHVQEERLKSGFLHVRSIHARLPDDPSRAVEVLCVGPDDGLDLPALRDERLEKHENHVAVRLTDPGRLEDLRSALLRPGGPRPDGGGYDPVPGEDGVTVLRFHADGRTRLGWPRRLEVLAAGRHTDVLLRHLSGDGAERRLLRRLTGAWGTQALRVMADLELADHLAEGPLTCTELGDRTGVDADRMNRLLRALCHPWVGALTPVGETYALTDLGRRLAGRSPDSMRHLALLYGDLLYRSFCALPEGIKDDVQPFTVVYGQPPFEYLRDHPRERRLFTRAMAEGSAFFSDVATVVDLSGARTVADIGGGDGGLLAHLCDTYPNLRCALLERPEVIGAARDNLDARGHLDRCTLVPGSFTDARDVPTGADVYIVARILHDWDDQTCLAILRAVHGAATADSTLLVIERPLPDDPADPSVSSLWDLHMLVNNVGGRERSREQYRSLLDEAGFVVVDERPLRLDMSVTIARTVASECRSGRPVRQV